MGLYAALTWGITCVAIVALAYFALLGPGDNLNWGDLAGWAQAIGSIIALAIAIWLPQKQKSERQAALRSGAVAAAQLAFDHMRVPAMFLLDDRARKSLSRTGLPDHAFNVVDDTLSAFPVTELGDAIAIKTFVGLRGALGTLRRLGADVLASEQAGADQSGNFRAMWHVLDQAREDVEKIGAAYSLPVEVELLDIEAFKAGARIEAEAKGWPK